MVAVDRHWAQSQCALNQQHLPTPHGQHGGHPRQGAPRVLFLLDGIPINDPFFGYVLFNKIVQETAEAMLCTRVVPCHSNERLHRWR